MKYGETKDVFCKGKTFRFHFVLSGGGEWKLLWTNGWEIVDEVAKEFGWIRTNLGSATYGHQDYILPV